MKLKMNGKIVEFPEGIDKIELSKDEEIAVLKQKLHDTDYMAIKHSEGRISDKDYAPISEQREAWRARIRELEAEV